MATLSIAELVSRVLSFFASAYLARVLTPEGFGILGFAFAIIAFFATFISFGLDIVAIRDISRDKNQITKYVNNIITFRAFLFVIAFLFLVAISFMLSLNYLERIILLIVGLSTLGNAFLTNYVFLAVEKMGIMAVRQIASSAFYLLALILFVDSKDDLIVAAIISTSSLLLNSLLLLTTYKKIYNKIKFGIETDFFKKLLKDALPLALSSIVIATYFNVNPFMLGLMRGDADVGIYNAAFKILLLVLLPLNIILKSYSPSISRYLISPNKTELKNYIFTMILTGVGFSTLVFLFANPIILFVFGEQYSNSVFPLKILALSTVILSFNFMFGQPLSFWGKQKIYSLVVTLGLVTNIILNIFWIPKYSFLGAAYAILFAEVIMFCINTFVFVKTLNKIKHK